MSAHLKIELFLHLDTAFHCTGNVRRPGVDKALARNAQGCWTIPATTLKGFLREKCEILLRTWGREVCIGPNPESMCRADTPCLVCQVFGNPQRLSALRFTDGVAHDETESAIRSGVAISRYRRAAVPQRLFFIETTAPLPTEWYACCEGDFPDVDSAKTAAALVALAARWGTAIGGSKSRGLGWIQKIRVKATLDCAEIPEEELVARWQGWKEEAHVAAD